VPLHLAVQKAVIWPDTTPVFIVSRSYRGRPWRALPQRAGVLRSPIICVIGTRPLLLVACRTEEFRR